MTKQLFFDDNKLFGLDNAVRKQGKPELAAVYSDEACSTDYCTGYVFKLENGKYRMLYMAHGEDFHDKKLFSAISCDGVNFLPEKLHDTTENTDKLFCHEIMDLPHCMEIAFIYEDEFCDNKNERYKLLMSDPVWDEIRIDDTLYTSPDLINWTLKKGVSWGDGTEPLTSVFYNKHKKVHTIIERPYWGIRCVGYKETADWENFTEYRYCLNVDVNDDRLAELYGMYAFEYDGMYIGVPHLYRHLKSEFNTKYKNGIIDTQLAYSYDGRYWTRGIREPFISGINPNADTQYNLMWVSNMIKSEDGNLYFYAAASEAEHGMAFENPGTGKMHIYRLRKDGFVSLVSEDKDKTASVITREKVWHSGELHLNLKAKKATVGVFVSEESEMVESNLLGNATPLEGYGHEDCIEFNGDSTDWVPQYKTGKTLDELKGKTLVFELRFNDGEIFSLSGDYTDVFNVSAARYRKYGVLPE